MPLCDDAASAMKDEPRGRHPDEPELGRPWRFDEAERRAIVQALKSAGWRISGRHGAAELLGLKPTTLHAKMKRLGVQRPVPGSEIST
jgi:transcriptional regulator with GAF, ATPase, and Fis domain